MHFCEGTNVILINEFTCKLIRTEIGYCSYLRAERKCCRHLLKSWWKKNLKGALCKLKLS